MYKIRCNGEDSTAAPAGCMLSAGPRPAVGMGVSILCEACGVAAHLLRALAGLARWANVVKQGSSRRANRAVMRSLHACVPDVATGSDAWCGFHDVQASGGA